MLSKVIKITQACAAHREPPKLKKSVNILFSEKNGHSIYRRQQQALLFCISNPLFCLILSYIPSLFQTPDKYEVAQCVGFSISYKIAYSLIRIQGICPLHKQTVLIYQVLHMRFVLKCTMQYHNHLGSNKLYF